MYLSLFSLKITLFQGLFSKIFIKKNNISNNFDIEKDTNCSKKANSTILLKKRQMNEAKKETVKTSTRGRTKILAKMDK